MRLGFLLFVMMMLAGWGRPAAGQDDPPARLRVAVVAFQDFEQAAGQYERLLAELSAQDPELRFELAVGTYGDARYWMEKEMVDVAIVTPAVFAETIGPQRGQLPARYRYLVTESLPRAVTPWAAADRRQGSFHDFYRAVCVVSEQSQLKSAEDLQRAADEGQLRFVFVHPLSASGHCVPRVALGELGITPDADESEFTFSHTASLRRVRDRQPAEVEHVAFVWDDVLRVAPELGEGLRRLELPQLEQRLIPADAVLVRDDLAVADRLKQLLLDYQDPQGERRFSVSAEMQQRTEDLVSWCRLAVDDTDLSDQAVSLGEIGRLLLHHRRTHGQPPRVALVLPGGGAKCSYQVGAIAAVEEALAALRQQEPDAGADIQLVVGTSGGAINALPVALGISSSPQGRRAFGDVWAELDQRQIVQPSLLVRMNIGVWFMLVQIACALWLVRRRVSGRRRQRRSLVSILVGLGLAELLLVYVPPPWTLMGNNHLVHHAWLWLSFGLPTAAWTSLAVAFGLLLAPRFTSAGDQGLVVSRRATRWLVAVSLLLLPLIQVITVLGFQTTLSQGDGMIHALSTHFPTVIAGHLRYRGRAPLELTADETAAERLRSVSRQIVESSLLERDLVVTASCLGQSADDLPSDLYFFAPAAGSVVAQQYGARGVDLRDHPSVLLDVVAGSGSIYPVFPSRRIDDFPRQGQSVELVDGGFAHNSPTEAAVLWGATHIILIESQPEKQIEVGNFAQNALASFQHLHSQAQLLDARSRGRVMMFSLTPQPPHMCVLDFSSNLVKQSIARGYRDAGGGGDGGGGRRFRKELGEPIFVEIPAG